MSNCPYCGVPAEEGCSICAFKFWPEFEPEDGYPTDENFWRGRRWLFDPRSLRNVDPILAYMTPREPQYDQ